MSELTVPLGLAYSAVVTMAVVPIWVGSHLGISNIVKVNNDKSGTKSTSSVELQTESISSNDAMMFPVIGSGVLFGLYLLFRLFSKEYINYLLTAYFLLFGVGALTSTISSLFCFSLKATPGTYKFGFKPFWSSKRVEFEFSNIDIVAFIISLGLAGWYGITKHWIANNILGLAFSVQGVALMSVGSYKIGCQLLGGLFFYDIFWVFATDVMVTVAKSFDAPIKLLFPKDIFTEEAQYQFSMLGLGDIVIPGFFIAMLLRFDFHRSGGKKNFSKTYFYICLVAYTLGLVTTIGVMHFFKHAQPALLYLVPFCVFSSYLTAVFRGETKLLLDYSEGEQEKEKDKKDTKQENTGESTPTGVASATEKKDN